ncbi:uncharacterized protein [Dermacentor andersoni]|uniref:uncharacterized protein n=1 Tax=Dermacentor andersoni TaxID=34620 RepID=UPI003B3A3640
MKRVIECLVSIFVILVGGKGVSYYAYAQSSDCRVVFNSSIPKDNCYYRCHDGNRWQRGMHVDGTACWPRRRTRLGRCTRGVCIVQEDEGSYFNTTTNNERCDGQYLGKGYATLCEYTCIHQGRHKRMHYAAGTPCIPLNEEGERKGDAGICYNGVCRPYQTLEKMYPNIMNKVFTKRYHKCADKDHYGRNVLWSCHYYCEKNNHWFFGYYKRNYNSACEMFGPRRVSGYCCEGKCLPKANCGQDIEDSATRRL